MGETNCTISAPGFGTAYVYAEELGYGLNIISSESETAHKRVHYPFLRTSGLWYVDTIWPDRFWFVAFQQWLSNYFIKIADPRFSNPPPMTLSVPSRNFVKNGFPEEPLTIAEDRRSVVYKARVSFMSAGDPMDHFDASQYVPPSVGIGNLFYPGGFQSNAPPRPEELYVPPEDRPQFSTPRPILS